MINNYYLLPEFTPARLQDLVLWFEPASFRGNTWYNLAPNYSDRNHGTAHGGVGLSSWHPLFPPALTFDGVDDYVKVPDSNSLDITNEITIEAWVKPEGDFSDLIYPIIVRKTGAYSLRYSHDNGNLIGQLWIGGGVISTYSLTDAWDTTKWTHFIFVYDGEYLRLYRDGSEAIPPRPQTGSINVVANNLGVGANGEGNLNLSAFIYVIRIYKAALTPTEIHHNYTHHPLYYIRRGVDPYEFIKRKKFYFL